MTDTNDTNDTDDTDTELDRLLEYLREVRAFDFTGYKRGTLARRVHKRMEALGIDRHGDYIAYLEVHPDEFEVLFNTILINVTSFFRDQETWDALGPVMKRIAERSEGRPIRVWSAGCASGQEAYSAVMMFAEHLGIDVVLERLKVYATDIDNEALEQARQGTYGERELESLAPEYVQKYFEPTQRGHTIRNDLRRVVIFGRHDLLQDPPISRIDLLICRNTLMYFNTDVQDQLVGRLHYSLADEGVLVLGRVESLLGRQGLFTVIDAKQRLFSKVPRSNLGTRLIGMAASDVRNVYVPVDEANLAELAFEHHGTAQLMLDRTGALAAANARARTSFNLSSDAIGRPFQDLEISYRPVELRSSIDRARQDRGPVTLREVERWSPSGDVSYLDIAIVPLERDGEDAGVLLSFIDTTVHRQMQEELEQTHRELETAYEELQSTNEELETTNEELQSTIEELETTNEELQSTNEELETMNEELSSTNEEFQSINDELRDRTNEFNQVNSYMESVLKSLEVSVIVVDLSLNVRIWNGLSFDMWGLRSEEVEGKGLLTLDIGFPVEALGAPIRAAFNDAEAHAIEVDATSRRGRSIRCRARVNPLEGQNAVDGAIILIHEIAGGDASSH